MENKTTEQVHRVGAITCGTALIVTGILFLLHIVFPMISYLFIFRLWPCIFILLGIEILLSSCKKNVRFVYDAGAVVMLILLLLFAVGMAFLDYLIQSPYAASFYYFR